MFEVKLTTSATQEALQSDPPSASGDASPIKIAPTTVRNIQNKLAQRNFRGMDFTRSNRTSFSKPANLLRLSARRRELKPQNEPITTSGTAQFPLRPTKISDRMANMSIFQSLPTASAPLYDPLFLPTATRLLLVRPGSGNDQIVCYLHFADTASDQCPAYEAISYVWGDITEKAKVLINGTAFQVTRNLHNALKRVRRESMPRLVWVDAICINQEDKAERGHQVRLMRTIFQKASQVIVWLGEDPLEVAESAFTTVRAVASESMMLSLATTHGEPPKSSMPTDDSFWKPLATMFSLPWFWRLWVIQEITLSSTAVAMWGSAEVAWRWIGMAAQTIRTHHYPVLRDHGMQGVYNAYFMYFIQDSLSPDNEDNTNMSFLRLLSLTRQFGCTDPRDRVYGLLGLPSIDAEPQDGLLFTEPNYNETEVDVYRKVAHRILETDQSLRLLCHVQHGTEVIKDECPTWVPRWDKVFTHTIAPSDPEVFHTAAKDLQMERKETEDPDTLIVRGVKACSVSTVLPIMTADYLTSGKLIEDIRQSESAAILSDPSLLSRTLTGGKEWYGMFVESERKHTADFAACLTSVTAEPLEDSLKELAAEGDPLRFLEAASNACQERRLFQTVDGHLGLGPAAMKAGDMVCVLFGSTVPFILREVASETTCFQVVGECYVQSLMKGRAIDEWRNGKLIVDDFVIV